MIVIVRFHGGALDGTVKVRFPINPAWAGWADESDAVDESPELTKAISDAFDAAAARHPDNDLLNLECSEDPADQINAWRAFEAGLFGGPGEKFLAASRRNWDPTNAGEYQITESAIERLVRVVLVQCAIVN